MALAAAAALQGCSTLTGTPAPAPEPATARPEPVAKTEEFFKGRWYVLDKTMSCLQDRTVTFGDGKAIYETLPGGEGTGEDGGTDQPAGGPPAATDGDAPAAPAPVAKSAAVPAKSAAAPAPVAPVTLPYHIESDAKTGLKALVVTRPDGEDRYWMAGPDFLLALNANGYDLMAHCD
jgi:hypothetical protein